MGWKIVEQDGNRFRVAVAAGRNGVWVGWQGRASLIAPDRQAAGEAPEDDEIRAPMTARVVRIEVAPGANVAEGDLVAVLEAMKMEYRLTAPRDGVVADVLCAAGEQIDLGAPLVKLERSGTLADTAEDEVGDPAEAE